MFKLSTRDFAIVGDADFVGHVVVGELFLVLSSERYFGNGVDAVRIGGGVVVLQRGRALLEARSTDPQATDASGIARAALS